MSSAPPFDLDTASRLALELDAVLAWATVGEVANCLRDVFGEHRDAVA